MIPAVYETDGIGYGRKLKEGTGIWEEDYPHEGLFHTWGLEADGEGGTNSIAIVELPDGIVAEVYPTKLKFVE